MKERPILMNAFSVQAILVGQKIQTRRVIKPQPPDDGRAKIWTYDLGGKSPRTALGWRTDENLCGFAICPYGIPGDRLWVKETWSPLQDIEACRREREPVEIAYRADDGWFNNDDARELLNDGKWKPSLFMPRWASRILMEILDVRVERVQAISEADSEAEGLLPCGSFALGADLAKTARQRYAHLWDSINAKRGYGWDLNSWVWIIQFEVIDNET